MNVKSLKNSYELFFVLFFTWTYLVGSLLGITRHFLSVGVLDIAVLDILLLLFFFNVFGTFKKRLKMWPITSSLILIFLLCFACLFSTRIETNFSVMRDVIFTCLPLLLFGSCVRDYKKVYKYLLNVMIIFVIFSIISYLLFGIKLNDEESYSQQQAYRFLLPAIVLICDTLEHFSLKCFFSFLICIFLILAYGARGPLVAVVCFVIFYLLFSVKKNMTKKNKLSLFIIFIIVIIALSKYGNSFYMLSGVFDNMNMSSRTVTMITDGTMLEDDARNSLATICYEGIMKNPILGVGPANDRNYIAQYFHSDEDNTGKYPHNFFLEVLLQFGVLLGAIIVFVFFRIIYKAYKNSQDRFYSNLLLVLFAAFFVPLMYSGSYLIQEGVYLLLAFCISKRNKSSLNPIHAN